MPSFEIIPPRSVQNPVEFVGTPQQIVETSGVISNQNISISELSADIVALYIITEGHSEAI